MTVLDERPDRVAAKLAAARSSPAALSGNPAVDSGDYDDDPPF